MSTELKQIIDAQRAAHAVADANNVARLRALSIAERAQLIETA